MPSPTPYRIELLNEEPDAPAAPNPEPRVAQLAAWEARLQANAAGQQKAALYIQTLLQVLGLRSLLLLALAASTGLCLVILTNPEATLPKMILAAATSALMILPIVLVILRKG